MTAGASLGLTLTSTKLIASPPPRARAKSSIRMKETELMTVDVPDVTPAILIGCPRTVT